MPKEFNWDAYEKADEKKPDFNWDAYQQDPRDNPSALESGFRGVIKGASFGFADELGGGLEALGSLVGVRGLGGNFSDIRRETPEEAAQSFGDVYTQQRDIRRERDQVAAAANPKSFMAGEIGGGVTTAIGSGGLGIVGKGAQASTGAARVLGSAAAEGALYGAGEAENAGDIALEAAKGAGVGLLGGALGVGAGKLVNKISQSPMKEVAERFLDDAVDVASDTTKKISKKSLSVIGGVDDKAIEEYLKRSQQINSARGIEDLATEITETIRQSGRGLGEKVSKIIPSQQKYRPLEEISTDVVKSLDVLKQRVIKGSQDALMVLPSDKTIERRSVLGLLKMKANELGKGVTKTSQSGAAELQGIYDRLKSKELRISLGEVKSIIKELDQEIDISTSAGTFADPVNRAKLAVRKQLDKLLKKSSPEYKEAMIEVAKDAKILNKASDFFGDPDKSARMLKAMTKDPATRQQATAALNMMDEALKTRFAQENITRSTSETLNTSANKASQDLEKAIEKGNLSGFIEKYKGQFPEMEKLAGEAKSYDVTNNIFKTRDATSTKLKSLANRPSEKVDVGDALRRVDEIGGTQLYQENVDRMTSRAFDQDLSGGRGPRNRIIGALIGLVSGGPAGAIAGGVAGGALDKYGGRATKAILDSSMRMAPSAQKLGNIVRSFPNELGKFAPMLQKAAERGQTALGASHYILWSNDPEYREMWEGGLATALDQ